MEAKPTGSRWNRNLFATALVYGFGAAPVAYGLYAAPLYLTRVLHQPQSALGHLLWVPPAGCAATRYDRASGKGWKQMGVQSKGKCRLN